jgi:hypothetical protein
MHHPLLLLGLAATAGMAAGSRAPKARVLATHEQKHGREPWIGVPLGTEVGVHTNRTHARRYKEKIWSVLNAEAGNALAGHVYAVKLKDAGFRVGESGAKRITASILAGAPKRGVVALVTGTLQQADLSVPGKAGRVPKGAVEISYDPRRGDIAFMRQDKNKKWTIPVASAKQVWMLPCWGVWAVGVVDKTTGAAARGKGIPSRSTQRQYQGVLSELKRRGSQRIAVSRAFPDVGLIVHRPGKGFYVGQHKTGSRYTGGIGPFKTTYEATMAIWHMEQSGVQGQRAKSKRDFVNRVWERQAPTMPDIELPSSIPGMEGPFRYRSGKILYWDPKEGKYYDRGRDLYVEVEDVEVAMSGRRAKSHNRRVSKCISGKVRGEGWTQRRAVAACQNMNRSKRLRADGSYIPKGSKR